MDPLQSRRWQAVPLALASAALFGASTPIAKIMLAGIDPWLMAGLLYLGAGVGLFLARTLYRMYGGTLSQAPLRRTDLPILFLIVVAGGIAGPLLLMLGLSQTQSTTASLLLNMESLATLAIAWIVFKENVDIRIFIGAMAMLAGALVLSWGGEGVTIDTGALLIIGACIAWAIDNNLTRKLSSADPTQIAMIKGLVAGSTNLTLALMLGSIPPPVLPVLAVGLTGFLGYGVSLVLFIVALRHLGTARTGAYFAMAPFIGAALSMLLLDEAISTSFVVAGALMAVGLWLHLAERHEHGHRHEVLEHEHAHIHDLHHRHDHENDGPTGVDEPHSHMHRHEALTHKHPHYPDLHHRHRHA